MISDEMCEDTMIRDVFFKPASEKNNVELSRYLTDNEMTLFEKYAPKLFNTFSKPDMLEDAMTELVKLYLYYKHNKSNPRDRVISIHQFSQETYDNSPIPNKNKSREKQVDSFKTNLEAICKYLGGLNYGTEKGNELKPLLKDAYENPDKYVPKRDITTHTTTPIKRYLKSLKLENKNHIISEFIKELNNIIP